MLRKQEKNAVTRGVILAIGWGWGLDRFYEGDKKRRDSLNHWLGNCIHKFSLLEMLRDRIRRWCERLL